MTRKDRLRALFAKNRKARFPAQIDESTRLAALIDSTIESWCRANEDAHAQRYDEAWAKIFGYQISGDVTDSRRAESSPDQELRWQAISLRLAEESIANVKQISEDVGQLQELVRLETDRMFEVVSEPLEAAFVRLAQAVAQQNVSVRSDWPLERATAERKIQRRMDGAILEIELLESAADTDYEAMTAAIAAIWKEVNEKLQSAMAKSDQILQQMYDALEPLIGQIASEYRSARLNLIVRANEQFFNRQGGEASPPPSRPPSRQNE